MKKKKWICPVLIVLCVALFLGYSIIDDMTTDTTAPQIKMPEQTLQVSVADGEEALLQGVTALDETDGDVTDSLVVESLRLLDSDGTVSVSYAAFDKSGNVAKAQRQLQYSDYESPRFVLESPLVFTQSGTVNVLNRISAVDFIDGDITHRIRATNLSGTSISTQGSYEVQFRVTNSLGDTVQLQLPVEVYAPGTYDGTLALTDYLVYLPVGSEFHAESYLKEYTLSGETHDLSGGMPEGFTLQTSGQVDPETPGVYVLTYKVTYTVASGTGSRAYTGYTKLIVVVEG